MTKLPFSNQFERGHSFNWAKKWAEGKYYFNNEYVTDFLVCDGMLLACRKDHESSLANKPIPIKENGIIIGIESPYWDFIAAVGNKIYVPTFDQERGVIIWNIADDKDVDPTITTPFDIDEAVSQALSTANRAIAKAEELEGTVGTLATDISTGLANAKDYTDTKTAAVSNRISEIIQATIGASKQIYLTQAEYDALVENDDIDEDASYYTYE